MVADQHNHIEYFQELCPGCGKIIDRRKLKELISHFNFNMQTGQYDCLPVNADFKKGNADINTCLVETAEQLKNKPPVF